MNAVVAAANKNIKKLIQKMTVTYKDWHEMLLFTLHGYRTTARTSTGQLPSALYTEWKLFYQLKSKYLL